MKSVFAALFLSIVLVLSGCAILHHGKKGKRVKAPVAITFLDANRLLSIRIPSVTITLSDAKGQVVTPNGLSFSSLDVSGGVLSLALNERAVLSNENPYSFTLQAEAPGYMGTSRSVVMYSDSAQYIIVFMTKVDDPPAGMAGFTGDIPIANSTVTKALSLTPSKSNKVERKVSVGIPEGTVLTSYGKRLDPNIRDIRYNFAYASPSSVDALRTFPGSSGGTLITDAVDSLGKPVATPRDPFIFISTGWMTLEMTAGERKVDGFSRQLELTMPVEKELINPATKEPYRVGDNIPTWSLNDRGVWKREGTAQVRNSEDGLIAIMAINHLSTWNLDNGSALCSTTKSIPYTSGAVRSFYCEIIGVQNGLPFSLVNGQEGADVEFLSPNGTHNIMNAPSVGDVRFLVYSDGVGSSTIATSQFNCGTNPPSMTITATVPDNAMELHFEYRVGATRKPICNNAVFFQSGSGCTVVGPPLPPAWRYGGMLTVSSNIGMTTLHSPIAFGNSTCIRLYFGKSTSSATTISDPIDFTMNFDNDDGAVHDADFENIPGLDIEYRHFPATPATPGNPAKPAYFLITIPAGSLNYSSCP